MNKKTRVAPGVIVSTVVEAGQAETVTFVTDVNHRSGANVAAVTRGRGTDAAALHDAAVKAAAA